MRELIIKKSSNIGSLCIFLKNNMEYLNYINKNIPSEILDRNISEKIYYFINDIKSPLLCECGNHLSFIGFKNGYRKSCGNKECFIRRRKSTCIIKYGVDNPKKCKDIILKEKENIKKKWGVDHYMLDEKVREKFNKSMIDKYGVE